MPKSKDLPPICLQECGMSAWLSLCMIHSSPRPRATDFSIRNKPKHYLYGQQCTFTNVVYITLFKLFYHVKQMVMMPHTFLIYIVKDHICQFYRYIYKATVMGWGGSKLTPLWILKGEKSSWFCREFWLWFYNKMCRAKICSLFLHTSAVAGTANWWE